ncbi:MAG TPA: DUF1282 family protein [Clostridiales bacterium]|nr:DUF1282 family protein [Clostridiales bacterium]
MELNRRALSMKKNVKALVAFIALLTLMMPTLSLSASQATSYTYVLNEKGYLNRTQDAYLPDKTISDLELMSPEDLFVDKDNILYIADSGNRRIVKYSIDKGIVVGLLEYEDFMNPRGVFVTKKGDIYVADPTAKKVFQFDKEFNILNSYGKPDSPNFSETPFEPLRVAVDNIGNIYIVSEGVYNGVIQLAYSGEFLGYFTVNKTRLSFAQSIQNYIFTRAQLANLVPRVPTTFSNIFIDNAGIVYTTTMGKNFDGIKKHNTAGGNMFKEEAWGGWGSLTDVYVDSQGLIYTSCNDGYIEVFSSAGEFIFEFGSYVFDLDVSGLYSNLPTIAVDNNGNIWTADGEKGYLQSFKPTDYALMVYGAMGLYEEGLYEESLDKWNEVLRLNQMSVLAHNGVGKSYLHAQLYEDAMEHFKVAGNREYYSEAFWEVRNNWIQGKLELFIMIIVLLWITIKIFKYFDKNKKINKLLKNIKKKIYNITIIHDVLFSFKIPKHPIDKYYEIRVFREGSTVGATIIYLITFVAYIAYKTSKGFIYQYKAVEDMDINAIIIGFIAIITLFVICNYLVTSINDGDGNFKQVYMIPAYGLIPVIISMISITISSHYLTYNEAFILDVILYIGVIWTIIVIFLGFQTVHDYSFKETIISFILTAVFMVIAAVMALIIIIMGDQLFEFIKSIVKEMAQNVFI